MRGHSAENVSKNRKKKKKMLFFSYIWALGKIFTIERSIVHLEKKTVKN